MEKRKYMIDPQNPEKQNNGEVLCFIIKIYADYDLYVEVNLWLDLQLINCVLQVHLIIDG